MTDYLNESATAFDSNDCVALVLWGYRVKHINIQLRLFQSNSITIIHYRKFVVRKLRHSDFRDHEGNADMIRQPLRKIYKQWW